MPTIPATLPEWSPDLDGSGSALAQFIYDNEPGDTADANKFRSDLLAVLQEAVTGFASKASDVALADASAAAEAIDSALSEIARGTRKPSKLPLEPLVTLIAYVRGSAKSITAAEAMLDWLERHPAIDIGFQHGDGEMFRTVHKITGYPNDREWHLLAEAATLREALRKAMEKLP